MTSWDNYDAERRDRLTRPPEPRPELIVDREAHAERLREAQHRRMEQVVAERQLESQLAEVRRLREAQHRRRQAHAQRDRLSPLPRPREETSPDGE